MTLEDMLKEAEAETMRAETKLAELTSETARAKLALKRARKLARFLREMLGKPRPPDGPVAVPTNHRPEGITVEDEGQPGDCPDCGQHIPRPQAMAMHRKFKHAEYGGTRQ